MCSPSLPSIGHSIRQKPVVLTREVIIEKRGHKTAAEKKEWLQDHNIMLYSPNASNGRTAITGGGYSSVAIGYATSNNVTGTYNTSLGAAGHVSVIGGGGYSSSVIAYSSFTAGRGNTAITTMTHKEYDRLGKIGTKKWGFIYK
jgi:hypothetical protein